MPGFRGQVSYSSTSLSTILFFSLEVSSLRLGLEGIVPPDWNKANLQHATPNRSKLPIDGSVLFFLLRLMHRRPTSRRLRLRSTEFASWLTLARSRCVRAPLRSHDCSIPIPGDVFQCPRSCFIAYLRTILNCCYGFREKPPRDVSKPCAVKEMENGCV